MALKRDTCEQFDVERIYLTYLLTNTDVLKAVRPVLQPKLFSNQYSQTLVRWLITYYDKTEVAPGVDIRNIFLRQKTTLDQDTADAIALFLQKLAEDNAAGKLKSTSYNADSILQYLKLQHLRNTQEQLSMLIESGNIVEAENLIALFERIERPQGLAIDILKNPDMVVDAFNREQERLFTLPGVLGEALGWYCRGDLSGIVCPQKGGKSSHMMFCANIAAKLGWKVLIFNFEIVDAQIYRRSWQNVFHLAMEDKELSVPRFEGSGSNVKIVDELIRPKVVDPSKEAIQALSRKASLYYPGEMRIITYPRGSGYGLKEIEADLENLRLYEGFEPDFVVFDYAKIIRPREHIKDELERENLVWEGLAGLCSKFNFHGMTATQGNRIANKGKSYDISGLGGTYHAIDHVGRFYALWATKEERQRGLTHAKLWDIRDQKGCYDEVTISQCLDIGQWYMDSRWTKDLIGYAKNNEED